MREKAPGERRGPKTAPSASPVAAASGTGAAAANCAPARWRAQSDPVEAWTKSTPGDSDREDLRERHAIAEWELNDEVDRQDNSAQVITLYEDGNVEFIGGIEVAMCPVELLAHIQAEWHNWQKGKIA